MDPVTETCFDCTAGCLKCDTSTKKCTKCSEDDFTLDIYENPGKCYCNDGTYGIRDTA